MEMLFKSLTIFLLITIGIKVSWASDLCKDSPYSNICVKLGDKSYLIDGNAKVDWYAADRFCRRQNGYLVTIQNMEEMKLISDYLVSQNYLTGDQWFWIGANDLGSEGIFYSVETGNLIPFASWSPGQPDNAGGNENCAHLWKYRNGFAMNDVGCNRKIKLICKLLDVAYDASYDARC